MPDDWPEHRHTQLFLTKLREQPGWASWIAREAVLAQMEFARREHPAPTGFVASISPANEPSLALVRGLGFAKVADYDDPEDGLEHVYALRLPAVAS